MARIHLESQGRRGIPLERDSYFSSPLVPNGQALNRVRLENLVHIYKENCDSQDDAYISVLGNSDLKTS